MANIPIVGDIFGGAIDFFKDIPEILKSVIDLIGLLDDILILGFKTAKLLLSEIPKFVLMGIKQLSRLIPIITDFIKLVMEILSEYKDTSIILLALTPIIYLITILIDIISII